MNCFLFTRRRKNLLSFHSCFFVIAHRHLSLARVRSCSYMSDVWMFTPSFFFSASQFSFDASETQTSTKLCSNFSQDHKTSIKNIFACVLCENKKPRQWRVCMRAHGAINALTSCPFALCARELSSDSNGVTSSRQVPDIITVDR